jgi:hypothetical protein
MDTSRQPVAALEPAEDNGGSMEIKTEAPVADSAKTEVAATNAAKSVGGFPGYDVLYPSGLLQAVFIVVLLLVMFFVPSKWCVL